MTKEPVAISGGILAVVNGAGGLLAALGVWEPTADQLAAVATFVNVVLPLAFAYFVRRRVTPV